MNLRSHALLGVGAVLFVSSDAAAQASPKQVKHRVSCPTCAVELTTIATIAGPSDSVGIAQHSFLDRDSQGRFFAIGDNNQILVYDAHGRFLKGIGRRGNGPGEFSGSGPFGGIVDVVIGRGDSIFVFHPPKVTVYSPKLEYTRTIAMLPVSQLRSIHPLPDGTWLVSGAHFSPDHIGRTVFLVSADGAIVRSLGPERAVTSAQAARRTGPPFRVAPDRRSLWMNTGDNRMVLTQWSVDNREIASLAIDNVPYLPEPKTVTRRTAAGRVYDAVIAGNLTITGVDSAGQLWVWGKPPEVEVTKGVLEVIDPRTGEVRTSQKVTAPAWLFRSGDMVYSPMVDKDGLMTFVVSRYRFMRR